MPLSKEYLKGWNAAIEHAADIAKHLNGWGNPRQPDLAHHISKVIRESVLSERDPQ